MIDDWFNQLLWRPWAALQAILDILEKDLPGDMKAEAIISRAVHSMVRPMVNTDALPVIEPREFEQPRPLHRVPETKQ
jgi:hypothetical protein